MSNICVDNLQKANFSNAIYKSNRLIESSYRLSTAQNRLIYLGMTKLKKTILDKNLNIQQVEDYINMDIFEPIYIDVVDYKKRFNIKSNNLYIELAKIATELYEEEIIYINKTELEDKIVKKRWVITCEYDNNNKGIALQFHPSLIKDLLIFQTEFTKMLFDEFVDKLKNKNSFRIYELCKQYLKIGYRDFYVNDLRFKLGLKDDEYTPYGNFKNKLLKIAIKEINKNTDLELTLEEIEKDKKTRKVGKIRLLIKLKNKPKQLSFFETNEMAITTDDTGIVNKLSDIIGQNISSEAAHTIFTESLRSIDDRKLKIGVMDYIKEKVKVCKSYINKTNKDIDNYIGLLIRAVRDDWKDNVVITSGGFNDYEQRKYDGSDGGITTEELEKQLLAWE